MPDSSFGRLESVDGGRESEATSYKSDVRKLWGKCFACRIADHTVVSNRIREIGVIRGRKFVP